MECSVIQAYRCLSLGSDLYSLQQHSAPARSVTCSFHRNHWLKNLLLCILSIMIYLAKILRNHIIHACDRLFTSGHEKKTLYVSARIALESVYLTRHLLSVSSLAPKLTRETLVFIRNLLETFSSRSLPLSYACMLCLTLPRPHIRIVPCLLHHPIAYVASMRADTTVATLHHR